MNLDILMQQIISLMPKGQYPSINKSDIENLKIPVPPLSIQKDLILKCSQIDEEYNRSRMTIVQYREKINKIFDNLQIVKKSKRGG